MKEKNKYITIDILKETVEELLKINYNELRDVIKDIDVKVNEEELKKFLNKKRREASLNTKYAHVDESKYKDEKDYNKKLEKQWAEEDSVKATNHFVSSLLDKSYSYNDFAIPYYKKYMDILKEKINKLLDIVDDLENIFNGEYSHYKKLAVTNYLSDFGIILKKNNRLLKRKDAIRIIIPIIENYEKLKEIEEKANNLDSYIGFKLTENFTSETGLREDEIYPDSKLQNKNLDYININSEFGYIPLSKKQKKLIKDRDNKYFDSTIDTIKNMK